MLIEERTDNQNVVKGLVQRAALAAGTAGVASEDVLLHGEILQFAASNDHGALQRSDGGEGPARAASALILNGSDSSFGCPVNAFRLREILGC